MEVGNSGMFRPEMLLPLGLPENARVIAWGLSLERPTMIKYAIDNIRELLGHKVHLPMIMDNAICRLESESYLTRRQRRLEEQKEEKDQKENKKTTKNTILSAIQDGVQKLKVAATS